MEAWQDAELPVETLNQLTVEQLQALRHDLHVLDVRDQGEWEEGHIKDATHVPYYFIEQHLSDGQGRHALRPYEDRPLAVICGSGERSMVACSILLRHG